MSLITDTGDASRLMKYLADSIPQGEHPNPHNERVSVRLDVVQEAIDHIEWLEKGNNEWRQQAMANARHAEAARATARVAIGHLQAILNEARTCHQSLHAERLARDWLTSIGSEPA